MRWSFGVFAILVACREPNPAYRGTARPGQDPDSGSSMVAGTKDASAGLGDGVPGSDATLGIDTGAPDNAGSVDAITTMDVLRLPNNADAEAPDAATPDAEAAVTDTQSGVPPLPDAAMSPLVAGLIVHFNFDELAGTTIKDSVGGPSASPKGSASWIPGHTGAPGDGAMSFMNGGFADTAPGGVSAAVDALTTQMTIALWVNWRAPRFSDQQLVGRATQHWNLRLGTTGFPHVCITIASNGNDGLCGAGEVLTNRWQHVAMTWDGATVRLYLNGLPDGSHSAVTTLPSVPGFPLGIGAYGGGGDTLDGAVDDVRIYNRALNAIEVAALASQ